MNNPNQQNPGQQQGGQGKPGQQQGGGGHHFGPLLGVFASRALPMSAANSGQDDLNFRSPQSAIFRCASAHHSGYPGQRTNQ
jgi:hypothetical protein